LDEAEFEAVTLKDKIKEVIKAYDVGFGPLMMPLRLAVSGMGHGPDLTPTVELLGKETTIRRIEKAIKELG
jgi:glutamyl-tRNA synthetase